MCMPINCSALRSLLKPKLRNLCILFWLQVLKLCLLSSAAATSSPDLGYFSSPSSLWPVSHSVAHSYFQSCSPPMSTWTLGLNFCLLWEKHGDIKKVGNLFICGFWLNAPENLWRCLMLHITTSLSEGRTCPPPPPPSDLAPKSDSWKRPAQPENVSRTNCLASHGEFACPEVSLLGVSYIKFYEHFVACPPF